VEIDKYIQRNECKIFILDLTTPSGGQCWNLGHLSDYDQCTEGIYYQTAKSTLWGNGT
jgi:hypothetical protein